MDFLRFPTVVFVVDADSVTRTVNRLTPRELLLGFIDILSNFEAINATINFEQTKTSRKKNVKMMILL